MPLIPHFPQSTLKRSIIKNELKESYCKTIEKVITLTSYDPNKNVFIKVLSSNFILQIICFKKEGMIPLGNHSCIDTKINSGKQSGIFLSY